MTYAWVPQGQHVRIDGHVDRIPEFDPRTGDHLWAVFSVYRWTPGVETPMLDQENLLTIQGPGCYYCLTEYTPAAATRRCKGK